MNNREIEQVLALLAVEAETKTLPIAERRRLDDENGRKFPLPASVEIEPFADAKIKGEWVRIDGSQAAAAMLYLHGGGFVFCSPVSHRHLVAAICHAAKMNGFSLDYRLAPESPFPAAVKDATEAYRYILERGVPSKRIVIAGDSAGGGLTVAAMITIRDAGLPLPAAGVLISPWADLTMTAQSCHTRNDPMVARERLAGYAQLYLNGSDVRHPLASPLFADLKGLPPLLIQVGTEEILYDDSVHLEERAKTAGVEATLEIWDGMIHVWHYFHPMLTEGRNAIARIAEFINEKIKAVEEQ